MEDQFAHISNTKVIYCVERENITTTLCEAVSTKRVILLISSF